jgi:hypothetical protein
LHLYYYPHQWWISSTLPVSTSLAGTKYKDPQKKVLKIPPLAKGVRGICQAAK